MTEAMVTREVKVIDILGNDLGLQLYTLKKRPHEHQKAHKEKSLVLLFGWLQASVKGVNHYLQLYHQQGYDVLFIPGNVKYFIWPPTCIQFARTFLDCLAQNKQLNCYQNFLVHAISIGGYELTHCLMVSRKQPEKYGGFIAKLQSVIYDSVTYGSFEKMRTGVAYGLTTSTFLRFLIPSLLSLYFLFTNKYTLQIIEKTMREIENHPPKVPSLFFFSNNDPMNDADFVSKMVNSFQQMIPYPVMMQRWNESPHAGHLRFHRDKYLEKFHEFMDTVSEKLNGRISVKSKL